MKLKRHFEPAALDKWQDGRDKFVKDMVPKLVKYLLAFPIPCDEATAIKLLRNQFSDDNDRPPISHIEVLSASGTWRPSKSIIDIGTSEGWINIVDGRIVLKTADDEDDVSYDIVRGPGRYSCYTGKRLGSMANAIEHVAARDDDSPDPMNPSGYVTQSFYECELVAEKADG